MKFKLTERGFGCFDFTDRYGEECSIQESSLAEEEAIWFGVNRDRMHLTREQVIALLPILQRFADTGLIYPPEGHGDGRSRR